MTKKQTTKWRLKIKKNGETVRDSLTANYGRFVQYLRLGFDLQSKFKGQPITYFIKANYGKHLDCFGDITEFSNEGEYPSYELAKQASIAFKEVADEWEAEAKQENK